MPTCVCGRDFGNEGALASHQAHCDEYQQRANETTAPARGDGQQNQQLPNQTPDDPVELGRQAGQLARGLRSSDPVEKADAKQNAFSMLWSAVGQAGQQALQEERQQAQQAKQHGGEELASSEDFPTCAECGAAVRHMPDEPTFPCPDCSVELEHPDY